jgi:CRISPR-associated protein Cmr5
MPLQTIQQQRARYALKCVNEAISTGVNQKEYKRYAAALPAMIHMNGLGQAAAFYRSKKDVHADLYDLLSGWLTKSDQPYHNYRDLLKGITASDRYTYQHAQAEAQALMDWVKKFANAFMGEE